jgi:hypothetical protein
MSETLVVINEKNNQKSGDSYQLRPRAVIAVFPFLVREIDPLIAINATPTKQYSDYLNVRSNVVIVVDDILSLSINTGKGGPNHTLDAMLAPLGESKEYLQQFAPGDYVMAWIVNGDSALDKLIKDLKDLKPCNQTDSGLKFFGQLMSITENFKIAQNGIKNTRFSLSAAGFNQYNAQIFFSPFIVPKDDTNEAGFLFPKLFFKTLGDNIVDNLYSEKEGGVLNIQKQIKAFHKLLLGPGPTTSSGNNPLRSVNGAFGVPTQVAKVLGRNVGNSSERTFADLCAVILGVQKFNNSNQYGPLGPEFVLEDSKTQGGNTYGTYWQPDSDNYVLKGRKALRVSPTMGGTVFSLLQQISNPTINEIYFTLRPEPNSDGNLLPTMVCRQLPFVTHQTEDFGDLTYTKFFDLPRFMIPKEIVMEYSLSRNDALRLNSTMVRQDASSARPGLQGMVDPIAIQFGNWAFDSNDIKRNGMRFYPVKIDQDIIALDKKESSKNIRQYTAFISSIITNQHLKYTGSIQTFGIFDPICVGENLEFNDIVFHIEAVRHVYQVQNGLPIFRTSLSLSHGTHKSGDLDALQDTENQKPFDELRGGVIKDGKYKTIFVSSSRSTEASIDTGIG